MLKQENSLVCWHFFTFPNKSYRFAILMYTKEMCFLVFLQCSTWSWQHQGNAVCPTGHFSCYCWKYISITVEILLSKPHFSHLTFKISDQALQCLFTSGFPPVGLIITHISHDHEGLFPQLLSSNHKHFPPLHFIPFRATLHFMARLNIHKDSSDFRWHTGIRLCSTYA